MKKVILLMVVICISTIVLAQKNVEDVVYLINGAVMRGVIIEQVPNKYIKIRNTNTNVYVYNMDEIVKITKEPATTDPSVQNSLDTPSGLERGNQFVVEAGFGLPCSMTGKTLTKFEIVYGRRFNPYWALGVGSGIRTITLDGGKEILSVPLFLDMRVNFTDQRVSPYLSLGLGYAQAVEDSNSGFLFKPTAGISIGINGKSSVNIGLGIDIQTLESYSNKSYYSVGGNIGFSF